MPKQILDSLGSYKRRTNFLNKQQKKADLEFHEIYRNFEKKKLHFDYEISDVQTEMYYIKQDIKKLKHLLSNLLISLESFAKKEQLEKLEELNNNIDMGSYITREEFETMIKIIAKDSK